ncbi:MFS transporter [Streptomyces sp. NPDC088358]|uniref:MFS transporter n=1 Tax=Streptomyces sp. NPDC088358 TaxID=3365857 RepID=UPI0037F51DC4
MASTADMPGSGRLHGGRSLVWALGLGAMVVSMMQTLVVPVLGVIQEDLHASAADVGWLTTATLLSAAVCTPLLGRAGDQYGKRPVLTYGTTCRAAATRRTSAPSVPAVPVAETHPTHTADLPRETRGGEAGGDIRRRTLTMNALLSRVLDAAGGQDLWAKSAALRADISVGGAIWAAKGRPDGLPGLTARRSRRSATTSTTSWPTSWTSSAHPSPNPCDGDPLAATECGRRTSRGRPKTGSASSSARPGFPRAPWTTLLSAAGDPSSRAG